MTPSELIEQEQETKKAMPNGASEAPEPRPSRRASQPRKKKFMEWLEEFISRLSTRNNFWHMVCSWIWLPFAFSTGLRINRSQHGFTAFLPFRRFNKNWYSAMAGAVLLGNSEVAGGTYLFQQGQGKFRVVCKKLEYKFLRPCIGPALYRVYPREDLAALLAAGKDFNILVDMVIVQVMRTPQERERQVGKCTALFHLEPIDMRPRKAGDRLRVKSRKRTVE